MMNFQNDLREQITQLLREDNITFNKQDTTRGLVRSYLNVLNRNISVKKRKVLISDNINKLIDDNKLDEKYINALLQFKFNFENGININCHLSTNVFYSNLSVSKKNKNYIKSRDYLLDDWGIYHLHLNEKEVRNKKEMHSDKNDKEKGNRSEYLLFVKVTYNEVYFIDVLNHNDENVFAKQELIQTLDRNWHFLLEKYILHEVISIPKMTDMEIHNRRKNNEYVLYEINGKIFTPMGGGLTSIGINIIHTEKADEILADINIIEKDIKNRYVDIKKHIQKRKAFENYDEELQFKLQLSTTGYLITETNTNFMMIYHIEGDNFGIYYDGFYVVY